MGSKNRNHSKTESRTREEFLASMKIQVTLKYMTDSFRKRQNNPFVMSHTQINYMYMNDEILRRDCKR